MRSAIQSFCNNSRRVGCILLIIISTMIAAAYCGTLASPPYLDDYHSFIFQDKVHLKEMSFASLRSVSETVFGWKRWIPMVTFALNHKYGGSMLGIFHATNIFIHILVMLCAFFLASELIKLKDRNCALQIEKPVSHYFAFCIAALWALHPIQTSSVTYLVQRMASIQAMFFMASVALFIRARRVHTLHGHPRSYISCYAGSFLSTVCAFFSKENSFILPVMLLLTEIWFFQPDLLSILWNRFKRTRPLTRFLFCASLLLISWLALLYVRHLLGGYTNRDFTMIERVLTQTRVVVWYISLLLWPDPSRLCMEHDFSISRSLLDPPTTLLSTLVILILLWQIIRQRRRLPSITYGGLWFFANLAIESSIFPLEMVFEHRLYLPSFGFIFLLVIGLVEVSQTLAIRRMEQKELLAVSLSFFVLVSSCFALLTDDRNDVWSNPVRINMDNVAKASGNPRAHSNLANALIQAEQYDAAIAEAERCIELGTRNNESYTVAANVIVLALILTGDADQAVQRGEKLIADRPKDADADALPVFYVNLSRAYLLQEQYKKAFDNILLSLHATQTTDGSLAKKNTAAYVMANILAGAADKAIDLNGDGKADPGDVPPPTWIAMELLKQGEHQLARTLLSESTEKYSDEPETRRVVALLQKEDDRSQIQKAKSNFALKYVANPVSRYNICMAIAYLVQEKQMPSLFLKVGEQALDYCLKIEPDSADAHLLKGWYYFNRNDADMAVAEAERALKLDHEYSKAWIGYGFFLAKSNRPEDAIIAFEKALELYPFTPQRNALRALSASLRNPKPAREPGPVDLNTNTAKPGVRLDKPSPS